MFSVKVEGLKGLEIALKDLAALDARRVVRAALRGAAAPIEADMKADLSVSGHVDTGHVLRSVKTKISTSRKAQKGLADVSALIGVFDNSKETPIRYSKKAGRYVKRPPAAVVANWIEHGVNPHHLSDKGSGAKHPGFMPSPFIDPALSRNRTQAINSIKSTLAEQIEKAIAKNARKKAKQGG